MLSQSLPLTGTISPLREKNYKTAQALRALDCVSDPLLGVKLIQPKHVDKARDLTDKRLHSKGALLHAEDPSVGKTWIPSGVWATGAPTMWKQSITGKTCLVGVIDTGIDQGHPDLKGKVVIQHDYVKDKLKMADFNPHGTHVAGTIAANGKIVGVAPEARLADYRVLDKNGSGSNLNITKAIYQATLDGCDIINLSLGGPLDFTPMHAAVQNAVSNGVLVVVAVGNEGDGNPATTEISYPGYYHEVCGAGAVQFSTSADERATILDAYFTNTNDEVDVAAPGYEVWSTVAGGGYAAFSGTSMATPHVSGFAALLHDKFKMRTQQALPAEMLFSMVKTQTVDIDELGIDDTTGAGFITFYPEIPKKRGDKWVLEDLNIGMPTISNVGTVPSVRRRGRISGPYVGQKKNLFGRPEIAVGSGGEAGL